MVAAVNCVTTKLVVLAVHVDEDIELKASDNQSLVKTSTNVRNRDHVIQRMEFVRTSWEVINAHANQGINFSPKKDASVCCGYFFMLVKLIRIRSASLVEVRLYIYMIRSHSCLSQTSSHSSSLQELESTRAT